MMIWLLCQVAEKCVKILPISIVLPNIIGGHRVLAFSEEKNTKFYVVSFNESTGEAFYCNIKCEDINSGKIFKSEPSGRFKFMSICDNPVEF